MPTFYNYLIKFPFLLSAKEMIFNSMTIQQPPAHSYENSTVLYLSALTDTYLIFPAGYEDRISLVGLLWALRNEIASFQANQGVSNNVYGFFDLMRDIFFKLSTTITNIFKFGTNCLGQISNVILTIFWVFICVLRFIVDSTLAISMKEDTKEKLKQVTKIL